MSKRTSLIPGTPPGVGLGQTEASSRSPLSEAFQRLDFVVESLETGVEKLWDRLELALAKPSSESETAPKGEKKVRSALVLEIFRQVDRLTEVKWRIQEILEKLEI